MPKQSGPIVEVACGHRGHLTQGALYCNGLDIKCHVTVVCDHQVFHSVYYYYSVSSQDNIAESSKPSVGY